MGPDQGGVATFMDYAGCVTAERMAEAEADVRRGTGPTDFIERWTIRIRAWIVEQVLYWCGLMVDDVEPLRHGRWTWPSSTPARGMAAQKAVWMLRHPGRFPRPGRVGARGAADFREIRELASEEVAELTGARPGVRWSWTSTKPTHLVGGRAWWALRTQARRGRGSPGGGSPEVASAGSRRGRCGLNDRMGASAMAVTDSRAAR